MRALFVLGGCAMAALVAFVMACNGRIQREDDCSGVATRGRSAFCDVPRADPTTDGPGPFPPGDPFPPQCSPETVTTLGHGPVCVDDARGTGRAPGSSCEQAMDCASVCCLADRTGYWYPAEPVVDAGEADASADASTDADADASPAPPDGVAEDARSIRACACGVCPTAVDTCATANRPRGLGGP